MYEENYPLVTRWYSKIRERKSYIESVIDDFTEEDLKMMKTRGSKAWPKIASILHH